MQTLDQRRWIRELCSAEVIPASVEQRPLSPDNTTLDHAAVPLMTYSQGPRAVVVLHAPQGARVLELAPGRPLVVGRQFPADVVADDRTLSRQHARFTWREGALHVEDLDSRNGTWVRDKAVKQAVLRSGETFRLGALVASAHVMEDPRAEHAAQVLQEAIVRDERMVALYQLVERIAPTTAPVLVLGETGTGKELIAQALHRHGPRRAQPFRVLNCPAIPKELAESMLFGHERGAFTGADKPAEGIFRAAHGGTLFLDEVGELSLANQAILLRALETKRIQPLGARREMDVDVRIVAATHRDLLKAVADGSFREDLYYRLNGVTLQVPPLRERQAEIAPLAERFLADAAQAWSITPRRLSAEIIAQLRAARWPGNVRQLRRAMEHALLVGTGEQVNVADLPPEPRADEPQAAALTTLPPPGEASEAQGDFKTRVREYETEMILDALDKAGGNQRAAARLLQIPLRTLTSKLELYSLRDRIKPKKR